MGGEKKKRRGGRRKAMSFQNIVASLLFHINQKNKKKKTRRKRERNKINTVKSPPKPSHTKTNHGACVDLASVIRLPRSVITIEL